CWSLYDGSTRSTSSPTTAAGRPMKKYGMPSRARLSTISAPPPRVSSVDRGGERDAGERWPGGIRLVGDRAETLPRRGRLGEEGVEVGRAQLVGTDLPQPVARDEADPGRGVPPSGAG